MSTTDAYCTWVARFVAFSSSGESWTGTVQEAYDLLREDMCKPEERPCLPRSLKEFTRRLTRHTHVVSKKAGVQIRWGPGDGPNRKIRFSLDRGADTVHPTRDDDPIREAARVAVLEVSKPPVSRAVLPGRLEVPEATRALLPDMRCHEALTEGWEHLIRLADLVAQGETQDRQVLVDPQEGVLVWWEFPQPVPPAPEPDPEPLEEPMPEPLPEPAPPEPIPAPPGPTSLPLGADEETVIRNLLALLRQKEAILEAQIREKQAALKVVEDRAETVRVLLLG